MDVTGRSVLVEMFCELRPVLFDIVEINGYCVVASLISICTLYKRSADIATLVVAVLLHHFAHKFFFARPVPRIHLQEAGIDTLFCTLSGIVLWRFVPNFL